MADQLLTGTTLVESTSRSDGDIPVGGIIEFNDTYTNLLDGFVFCNGEAITDAKSSYNGTTAPDYNTQYLSIPGTSFKGKYPDTNDIHYAENEDGAVETDGAGILLVAPLIMPNGITVTKVAVYGNTTSESWYLQRTPIVTYAGPINMASAVIGTEDETITSGLIDNSAYVYSFFTEALDANDEIYGARITYTPRQKFIMRIR